jgi:hypothetical protein
LSVVRPPDQPLCAIGYESRLLPAPSNGTMPPEPTMYSHTLE